MQAVTIICNNEAAGLYRITHTPEFQKAQPFCEEILTGSRWLNSLQANSPYNGPRACECNSALSLLHSVPRCRYHGARKPETITRGANHPQCRQGKVSSKTLSSNSKRVEASLLRNQAVRAYRRDPKTPTARWR